MRNYNKVVLYGNVTAEPELNYTGGGTAVTNFSLATNESYKDQAGEWVEKAQFHNITAWGRNAELICEMVTKGTPMLLEGSLNYGEYDKQVGDETVRIRTAEVKLREFILTGNRSSFAAADDASEADEEYVDAAEMSDDDELDPDDELPF